MVVHRPRVVRFADDHRDPPPTPSEYPVPAYAAMASKLPPPPPPQPRVFVACPANKMHQQAKTVSLLPSRKPIEICVNDSAVDIYAEADVSALTTSPSMHRTRTSSENEAPTPTAQKRVVPVPPPPPPPPPPRVQSKQTTVPSPRVPPPPTPPLPRLTRQINAVTFAAPKKVVPTPPPKPPPPPPPLAERKAVDPTKPKVRAGPPPIPSQLSKQERVVAPVAPALSCPQPLVATKSAPPPMHPTRRPFPPPPPPPKTPVVRGHVTKAKVSFALSPQPKHSPNRQALAQTTTNISHISHGDDDDNEDDETVGSLPHILVGDHCVVDDDIDDDDQVGSKTTMTLNLSDSEEEEQDQSSSLLEGELLVDTPSSATAAATVLDGNVTGNVLQQPAGRSWMDQRQQQAQLQHHRQQQRLSKQEKERMVRAFHGKLETINKENEQLRMEYEKIQRQHEKAKHELQMAQKQLIEKTRATDERFGSKITEFESKLTQSRLQYVGERTKRTQCEQELQKQNVKNNELHQGLQETEQKLQYCQKQYSQLKVDLLKATRSNNLQLKTFSPQGFVEALTQKVTTLAEANERMSKIIDDAYKAIRARDSLERQLNGTMRIKDRLEKENAALVKECQELKKEVSDSQVYIDQLLKTSHEAKQEDWEEREHKYKRAIHSLNQRIMKQGTVVSLAVYKDEVQAGRRKSEVLQHRISDLEGQVAELQQEKEVMSRVLRSPITGSGGTSRGCYTQSFKSASPRNSSKREVGISQTPKQRSRCPLQDKMSSPFLSPPTSTRKLRKNTEKPSVQPSSGTNFVTPKLSPAIPETTLMRQVPLEIEIGGGGTSNWWGDKENGTPKIPGRGKPVKANKKPITPVAGRSPLQKARDFGGRLALKKKLDSIRSPRKMNFPSNRVQSIIHY